MSYIDHEQRFGRPLGRCGTFLALLCATACTGEVSLAERQHEEPKDTTTVEGSCRFGFFESRGRVPIAVGTFWREEPDSEAFRYLESRASAVDGTVTVTNYHTRQDLLTGLADQPVDVFQVNGGSDVLQFVVDDTLPRVCPLDELDQSINIRNNYFRAAWEPTSCRGSIYSLPLNVHRLNTVMVNLGVYQRLSSEAEREGIELPPFSELRDGDSLLQVLGLVKSLDLRTEQDTPIVPLSLCIGTEPSSAWPLTIVAFENLLASYADESYEAIWRGNTGRTLSEKEAVIRRLARDLRKLSGVSSLGPGYDAGCSSTATDIPEDHTWQRAAELVRTGEALLTIGGDWLRGLLSEEERELVVTFPYPGQSDTFVYTPDTFAAQFRENTDGSAARLWLLDVLSDPVTQVEFAKKKQAIPATSQLTEAEIENLQSEYLSDNYRQFRDCHTAGSGCRLLLAVSGLSPAAGTNQCFDQLGMVLAATIGVEYAAEEWRDFEAGCGRSRPLSPDEAEDALVQLLLEVSEAPYAEECRD